MGNTSSIQVSRDRHDFEWNLLSNRINALLTSQAFLIAGFFALLDNKLTSSAVVPNESLLSYNHFLYSVAIFGTLVTIVFSLAIVVNLAMIQSWVRGLSGGSNFRTKLPDFYHFLSTDFVCLGIVFTICIIWVYLICSVSGGVVANLGLVFLLLTYIAFIITWRIFLSCKVNS